MESDSVFEGAENPDNSAPTTSSKDVRSLFSKKKVRPAVIRNLPPPPPPPAPKVHSDSVGSHDEGWEREFQKLNAFLNEKGLHIVKVDSDGSCLFSSFALHFPDSSGDSIRQEAVTYMLENSDAFSPFIDTEAYLNGFDDYCARMRRPATWGGQLEIQAISQARGVNVYVFQTGGKSTVKMINFDEPETQCITLSYHDGEHYNSVLPTQSTELVTVSWLENRLSTENQPIYVDSNPVSKVPKTRKKIHIGIFCPDLMATPGVSVYVLRERLQESWEKRENLRLREEEILREVVGDTQLPAIGNRTLYEVALDAVVEGTQGYETLEGWRSKYLQRDA